MQRWSYWEIRIVVASGKKKIDLKVEQELSRDMKIFCISVGVLGYMNICMNVYCQNYEFYNVYVYHNLKEKTVVLMRQGL